MMMHNSRKSSFLLFVLSCILATPYSNAKECAQDEKQEKFHAHQSILQKYGVSLVVGSAIGVTAGSLCAMADTATVMMLSPATWYLCYRMRRTAVESVMESMDDDDIRHCKYVTRDMAWISSWISWFAMMGLLHR